MYDIKLNIFYSEPDPDRWFKYDHYPRKLLRRIFRGKGLVSGQHMVALNLLKGLDLAGISYRYNDYKYAKNNPNELIGVIGKPFLIFERKFNNPILFGASVFSHPIDSPDFFNLYTNVKKMLVPGPWIYNMFKEVYGNKIECWPVGIDTDFWKNNNAKEKYDVLIYNKLRWGDYRTEYLKNLNLILESKGLSYSQINYGNYKPEELKNIVDECKIVIFLCEHETQGLAYQQILSMNKPILALDKESYWEDPFYYPEKVKYKPVSSVPYWDNTCGEKFKSIDEVSEKLNLMFNKIDSYTPRVFIQENLSLLGCAKRYYSFYEEVYRSLSL